MKQYKFKNVKYSVIMNLEGINEEGLYLLSNRDYPTIKYKAKPEELEEVSK